MKVPSFRFSLEVSRYTSTVVSSTLGSFREDSNTEETVPMLDCLKGPIPGLLRSKVACEVLGLPGSLILKPFVLNISMYVGKEAIGNHRSSQSCPGGPWRPHQPCLLASKQNRICSLKESFNMWRTGTSSKKGLDSSPSLCTEAIKGNWKVCQLMAQAPGRVCGKHLTELEFSFPSSLQASAASQGKKRTCFVCLHHSSWAEP